MISLNIMENNLSISKDIDIFLRWLEIKQKYQDSYPSDITCLRISSMKSSLLERMLSGIEPLPIPPPTSFSYPWYKLIEDGVDYPYEVFELKGPFEKLFNYKILVINQSFWHIINKLGDDIWEVTYHYKEFNEDKIVPKTWIVKSTGIRNEGGLNPFDKFWEIKENK
jgi:hypothetical protein